MKNLTRYIIRAFFSQKRMVYHRKSGQLECRSKDGRQSKVFDALEWIATMCSHVSIKGRQMFLYYGLYSNVNRGRRKKSRADDQIIHKKSKRQAQRNEFALYQKTISHNFLTSNIYAFIADIQSREIGFKFDYFLYLLRPNTASPTNPEPKRETVQNLFRLTNIIIESMISVPQKVDS